MNKEEIQKNIDSLYNDLIGNFKNSENNKSNREAIQDSITSFLGEQEFGSLITIKIDEEKSIGQQIYTNVYYKDKEIIAFKGTDAAEAIELCIKHDMHDLTSVFPESINIVVEVK